MYPDISNRKVKTNGIHLNIAEQGSGPLVLLIHGFPESWYSWRHQFAPLSAAGYRVVAPDMRGYGDSEKPCQVSSYNQIEIVNDIRGVVTALGYESAIVIGHDWGAPSAWNCALWYPKAFSAVGALSVPFIARSNSPPLARMEKLFAGKFFYQLYFQEPGVAEQEFEIDIESNLKKFFHTSSGDGNFSQFHQKAADADLLSDIAEPQKLGSWLSDRDLDFYTKEFSNTGRSVHYLAVAATNLYENTRSLVQRYINAKDKNEIVFTKGATEAINLVANTFGQKFLNEGDEILLTELEHHSNYVPWHYLRKSKGVKINFAEINNDGEITIESIEKSITPKTKMIAITHLSNVTGAILPIKEITSLAHSKNIPILIDGCQGAPHLKLDMQDIDCDFYAISCHKMYGPTGLGVLYAKKKWLEALPPYQGGGGMIREVKKEGISFGDLPNKYEAGTMATAQVIAFGESIKFLNQIGIENIEKHESELTKYGEEVLRKNNSVKLVGNPKNKGSVLSFTLDGIHAHDIATILDEDGVAIRAGHHCCQILHDKLGLTATARASLGVYNTKEDLDKLNESINNCKKIFDR